MAAQDLFQLHFRASMDLLEISPEDLRVLDQNQDGHD